MAVNSRASMEALIPKKWNDREASPERTKVWFEPTTRSMADRATVQVIYYLSRSGHLEHPHFVEVSLASSQGLYLRDVVNKLNCLRGKGMASMYSWSCKRRYRSGYVWHDLSENDLIHPTNGHEYILKGSELLQSSVSFRSYESVPSEISVAEDNCDFSTTGRRRKNQSWGSFECTPQEQTRRETNSAGKFFSDATTLTDENRRRRRNGGEERENQEDVSNKQNCREENVTELSREEVSPPFSSSSAEGLGGIRMSGSGPVDEVVDVRDRTVDNGTEHSSGRFKASLVLKQLITCGSVKSQGAE